MIAATIIVGIAATLLVHEAGHAAAAAALRLPWQPVMTRRGPGIRIGRDDLALTRTQVVLTAAGGPLANLLLVALCIRFGFGFAALTGLEFAFLNLLPLPHSDGSRMLRPGRALARARAAA